MNPIRGILIDSGRVLNFPAMGSWSYSPKFFQIISRGAFDRIPKRKRKDAYQKAWGYINSIAFMRTLEEEREHFSEFFAILARELPELEIGEEKKKLLTDDFVYNFDKYRFYPDASAVLPGLSREYRLCVVSDAWPSLRGVYEKAGLEDLFEDFVISAELGITKPDAKMYQAALERLGLKAEEVVFVDDNPRNCDGAARLGIRSVILRRDLPARVYLNYFVRPEHKVVRDLYELERCLKE